jgi:hypothetical protein
MYTFTQGPPHVPCHVGVYILDLAIKSGVGASQAYGEQYSSDKAQFMCCVIYVHSDENEPILE